MHTPNPACPLLELYLADTIPCRVRCIHSLVCNSKILETTWSGLCCATQMTLGLKGLVLQLLTHSPQPPPQLDIFLPRVHPLSGVSDTKGW